MLKGVSEYDEGCDSGCISVCAAMSSCFKRGGRGGVRMSLLRGVRTFGIARGAGGII